MATSSGDGLASISIWWLSEGVLTMFSQGFVIIMEFSPRFVNIREDNRASVGTSYLFLS